MSHIDQAIPASIGKLHEANAFGNIGLAEQTLDTLAKIFASGMVAIALWIAQASV